MAIIPSESAQKSYEIVFQPAPGKLYNEATIAVNGHILQEALSLVLEQCTLMIRLIRLLSNRQYGIFDRFRGNVWERDFQDLTLR